MLVASPLQKGDTECDYNGRVTLMLFRSSVLSAWLSDSPPPLHQFDDYLSPSGLHMCLSNNRNVTEIKNSVEAALTSRFPMPVDACGCGEEPLVPRGTGREDQVESC